jgi:import receptor subunit TOM70
MAPSYPIPPSAGATVPLSAPTSASIPVPASAPAPPSSILTRTQRFIEENQRLILLGCAVLAASGAGYYLYSRSGDKPGPSSPGGASAAKKKNKKSKKKGGAKDDGKFLRGQGDQGPLVEEIKKPASASASSTTEKDKVDEKEAQVEDANAHLAGEPGVYLTSTAWAWLERTSR